MLNRRRLSLGALLFGTLLTLVPGALPMAQQIVSMEATLRLGAIVIVDGIESVQDLQRCTLMFCEDGCCNTCSASTYIELDRAINQRTLFATPAINCVRMECDADYRCQAELDSPHPELVPGETYEFKGQTSEEILLLEEIIETGD